MEMNKAQSQTTPMTSEHKEALRLAACKWREKWKAIRSAPIVEFDNMQIVLLDPWNIALIDAKASTKEVVLGASPEEGKVIGYFGNDLRAALEVAARKSTSKVTTKSLKELSSKLKGISESLERIVSEDVLKKLDKIMDKLNSN
jgi:hypothetical protein